MPPCPTVLFAAHGEPEKHVWFVALVLMRAFSSVPQASCSPDAPPTEGGGTLYQNPVRPASPNPAAGAGFFGSLHNSQVSHERLAQVCRSGGPVLIPAVTGASPLPRGFPAHPPRPWRFAGRVP